MTRFLAARNALARELQRARQASGLSTHELAARIEISQSKVSKIENARVGVSVRDVAAWARAVGTDEAGVANLSQRAAFALTETLGRHDLDPAGIAVRQHDVAALEAAASSIHVFETALLPGLLQTAEYARQVFRSLSGQPAELAVAARLERQSILYTDKELVFLLSAPLLDDLPGPRSLALGQLDRLRNLLTLRNVRIGLVRHLGRRSLWLGHAFTIYEGLQDGVGQVSVETLTTHLNISDERDVETYRATWAQILQVAEFGAPVVQAIEEAMRDWESGPDHIEAVAPVGEGGAAMDA